MNEDTTLRPAMPQRELELKEEAASVQPTMATHKAHAVGTACPHCGVVNEPEARFCASCGMSLHSSKCPHCGSELDADADFCESCHRYIRPDVCSFCGASFSEDDTYCPECGSPRGGIVCPACHTLNDFSFCKQCGRPLTADARQLVAQLRQRPDYRELVRLAHEYDELQMQLPYNDDDDLMHDEASLQLRDRVLRLLVEDAGVEPHVVPIKPRRVSKEDLDNQKKDKLELISRLLDQMAVPAMPSPAKVRNYAMAQKPQGVKLAWRCNYKQALHSSPCGCAKPQLGGKWEVLGHQSNQEVKDDK